MAYTVGVNFFVVLKRVTYWSSSVVSSLQIQIMMETQTRLQKRRRRRRKKGVETKKQPKAMVILANTILFSEIHL